MKKRVFWSLFRAYFSFLLDFIRFIRDTLPLVSDGGISSAASMEEKPQS